MCQWTMEGIYVQLSDVEDYEADVWIESEHNTDSEIEPDEIENKEDVVEELPTCLRCWKEWN